MALKYFIGFDYDPGAHEGSPNYPPVQGAGLDIALKVQGLTIADPGKTAFRIGVTDREEDTLGEDDRQRNWLVLYRPHAQLCPYIRLPSLGVFGGTDPFTLSVGFRFRIDPISVPSITLGGSSAPPTIFFADNISVLSLTSTRLLRIYNQTTSLTIEQDTEYYFEVVAHHVASAPGATWKITFDVWVNNELIGTFDGPTHSGSSTVNYTPQLGIWTPSAGATTANVQRWLFADIYATDHVGGAPYNSRLGPQMVLPVPIAAVDPSEWEVVGGDTAVEVLSDESDETYLESPLDDDRCEIQLDTPTNIRSVVNGLQVFARTRRLGGGLRKLAGSIENMSGQEIPGGTVSNTTVGFSTLSPVVMLPETAADALRLRHSTLQTATIVIKAE